jgi:tRNA(fMet)-specific endonuclease VapC
MGIILDSSILVAFERGRLDLERLLTDCTPAAIAAVTAAELLIGVHRADTPERRKRREEFVENILVRMPTIPFDISQARLYAAHHAELASRGDIIGDRDLQIAVTALSVGYELATLNEREFRRVSGLNLIDTAAYIIQ